MCHKYQIYQRLIVVYGSLRVESQLFQALDVSIIGLAMDTILRHALGIKYSHDQLADIIHAFMY